MLALTSGRSFLSRQVGLRTRSATRLMTSSHHEPGRANRLAKEESPYLLQHAHNPVDWFPWGDEAFQKVQANTKQDTSIQQ